MAKHIRIPLAGLAFATLALQVAAQSSNAQATQARSYHIESQPLPEAVLEWADQADMQVMWSSQTPRSQREAPEVAGRFSAPGALERVLQGSGLTFAFLDERTVTIRPASAAGQPSPSPGASGGEDQQREGRREVIRTAQASPSQPSPFQGAGRGDNSKGRGEDSKETISEIIVTGSHIRGAGSAGSKVLILDREYIESSGYASIPDVLRTLPQSFGGGVGEAQSGLTLDATAGNFNRGSGVNLRGLGVDSTLVLVNGRRQPGSGTSGAFFDVSTIPAAAVERIEVLTDGASAIYGSDAIGGVVNFIMRRDFDGAESRVRLGTYSGDASEFQASQLFGTTWDGGNVLFGYQYLKRDNLPRSSRAYTASDDLTRFGGSDYRSVASNPGNILDPATGLPAFAIPANQDGTSLAPSQLLSNTTNYNNTGTTGDLLPQQQMHSAFVNVSQTIGSRGEFFAEGRFTKRRVEEQQAGAGQTLFVPSSNPYFVDPFGGSAEVAVAYNFIDDFGPQRLFGDVEAYLGTVGIDLELPSNWRVNTAVSYGREDDTTRATNIFDFGALLAALADPNPATAFNPFGDGSNTNPDTIEAIRGELLYQYRSDVKTVGLIADGTVWQLPAGAVRLALGGDFRKESNAGEQFDLPATVPTSSQNLDREVSALFAELSVPIAEKLQLSLAGRQEHYSDFGDTFNPKLGVNWTPLNGWTVRGTWGTSFKAPRLIELSAIPGVTNFDFIIPVESPNGFVNALFRQGNNAALREQTATTWTVGLEYDVGEPGMPSGYVTLFNIRYKDRIAAGGPPGNELAILMQADAWASIISTSPTQAQLAEICGGPGYLDFGVPCDSSLVSAIVDLRLNNLAEIEARGIDFGIDQSIELSSGTYGVGLEGTYTDKFGQAVTSTSPMIDLADTLGNVPGLRLRGRASWSKNSVSVGAFLNFTKGYEDKLSNPRRDVGSWTTWDFSATYDTPDDNGPLADITLSASAVNAFNQMPPFADVGGVAGGAFGYDTANANLYGRVLSLTVSKRW